MTQQTETTDDVRAQNLNDALETVTRQEAANVLLGDETDDATVPFSIDTSGLSVTLTVYFDKGRKRGIKFANRVFEQMRARNINFGYEVTATDYGAEKTTHTLVVEHNLEAYDKRGE